MGKIDLRINIPPKVFREICFRLGIYEISAVHAVHLERRK